MIQTVTGPVAPDELGFCHSHEHLFLAKGHPATLNRDLCIDDYGLTLQELRDFRAAGGRAVVDAQPLGCGRMADELIRVSAEAGVHVVASTGFHKLAFYPEEHWIRRYSERELAAVFVSELTAGMFRGTDAAEPSEQERTAGRAGVIKSAVDGERMNDPDKRWFRAAAAASLATGAPLLCHTESAGQAVWLYEFYTELGVPGEAVILCHLDRELASPDIHRELVRRGAYLEYDTIGRFKYHRDEDEARWILSMLEDGAEDRLLLGLDTTRARLSAYGGAIGLTHMNRVFLPMLRSFGASEAQIGKLMVKNPARAYTMRQPAG